MAIVFALRKLKRSFEEFMYRFGFMFVHGIACRVLRESLKKKRKKRKKLKVKGGGEKKKGGKATKNTA